MDALYPLGGTQDFGYLELLFSLRGLEKFADVDRVFVIGDNPGFLNPETTKLFPFEETGTKDYRIAKKVEFACGTDISDDFLFCNDDHFFMKPIGEIPYYQKGDLGVPQPRALYDSYLNQTKQLLQNHGKTTYLFDVHCPIIYNKDKFMELAPLWGKERNYVVKSVYCNWHGLDGPHYRDHKLKKLADSHDLSRITENEVFSVYDCAMVRGVIQFLCEKFPEPSRFEKKGLRFELKALKGFKDVLENVDRAKNEVFVVENDRAMDLLSKQPRWFKILSIN
jgi:hypothetical protein